MEKNALAYLACSSVTENKNVLWHLHQVSDALDLGDEPRGLPLLAVVDVVLGEEDLLSVLLHGCLHLDEVLGLLHALGNLFLS
jgi:hypothetical protein